jgi:hypothetical protein
VRYGDAERQAFMVLIAGAVQASKPSPLPQVNDRSSGAGRAAAAAVVATRARDAVGVAWSPERTAATTSARSASVAVTSTEVPATRATTSPEVSCAEVRTTGSPAVRSTWPGSAAAAGSPRWTVGAEPRTVAGHVGESPAGPR